MQIHHCPGPSSVTLSAWSLLGPCCVGNPEGRWVSSALTPAIPNWAYASPQIRVPAFLDLFMQSLFKPGARINQDHKHKYIHILAYAASVVETWKKVPSVLGICGFFRRQISSSALILFWNFGCKKSRPSLVSGTCFLVFLRRESAKCLQKMCVMSPVLCKP